MGNNVPAEGNDPKRLYFNVEKHKWPIIYSPNYDISFYKLETLHPFDSTKWRRVFEYLQESGLIKGAQDTVQPLEANQDDLLLVHTPEYLNSLKYSAKVAIVVEVPPVAVLPNMVVQKVLLSPFRYQTGGTVMAGKLAKERGWAINIGGGFHHCSSDSGGGFCAYADITLSIKFMFEHMDGIAKVMIVDLDAHQGNGHEHDFMNDSRVFIMDMYNRWIYPNDISAKAAIDVAIELDVHTSDEMYLNHLRSKLPSALERFKPDMVVYNAGTDVLLGDPLGVLDITEDGVVERDEIVFREVRQRNIPLFMVTSGGYQRSNAEVIANSIKNLHTKTLITSPDATSDDITDDDPPISSENTPIATGDTPVTSGDTSISLGDPPISEEGVQDGEQFDESSEKRNKRSSSCESLEADNHVSKRKASEVEDS